ncbi:MAG TPA: hypothetical protein VF867_14000 [Arthrobacter sp.]|jgi:hypothetical protein
MVNAAKTTAQKATQQAHGAANAAPRDTNSQVVIRRAMNATAAKANG